MRRVFGWSAAAALAVCSVVVLQEGSARADEGVVVVKVDPSVVDLDAEKLRAAVGEELHATAVSPEDPRASGARGTLDVREEVERRVLVITYEARTPATTRKIALPNDPAAAQREAVLVAGNLARDEGNDLARELRKKKEAAERSSAPASTADAAPAGAHDERRAHEVLAYYAGRERAARAVLLWGLAGIGAAGVGAGAAVYAAGNRDDGSVIMLTGGAMIATAGISALLLPSPWMTQLSERAYGTTPDLEDSWARAAKEEHRAQVTAGIVRIVAGAILGATGAVEYAIGSEKSRLIWAPYFLITGGVCTVLGVVDLATEGPTESAWHAYQKATGVPEPKLESVARHLRFAVVPGGAVGGIGGVF